MSTTRMKEQLQPQIEEKDSHLDDHYYNSLKTDFRIDLGELVVEPKIYAPTAAGLQVIAKKYKKLYHVEIQVFDSSQHTLNEKEIRGDNILDRFKCFQNNFDFSQLQKIDRLGIILVHGHHHAVPVFLSREDNHIYMIIFDSTSGSRKKGYWKVAGLFPEFIFLLNNGTRQSDTGSCFTDAMYTLKDALNNQKITGSVLLQQEQGGLEDSAAEPEVSSSEAERRSKIRFSQLVKPNNFSLFTLPTYLLKTSQRSEFVMECNPDMNEVVHSSSGTTLEQHRQRHRIRVTFLSKQLEGNACTFLHKKALEHKEMIDNHRRASLAGSVITDEQEQLGMISELIEDYLPYESMQLKSNKP